MTRRYAIVNADDFGQSRGVNRGVITAYERGILTSTSLMVRWPAAAEAAQYARENPKLGVGLHIDLGEWKWDGNVWLAQYEVTDLTKPLDVAAEVERQFDDFVKLVGRPPSHIDSHQHVHKREPMRTAVDGIAARYGIVLRDTVIKYCGHFYGQDENGVTHPDWISVEAFIDILRGLDQGVTEIACHPAAADDLDTMYRGERLIELQTLCDPRLREAIAELDIALVNFADYKR